MGQVVGQRRCVTSKETGDGRRDDLGVSWAFSSMQGWRATMEDAHVIVPKLRGAGWGGTALFAVMDGHGGDEVAHFCSEHMPFILTQGWSTDIEGSLRAAYFSMDEMLWDPDPLPGKFSCQSAKPIVYGVGCTAVVCCVRSETIVCANAGDSRAILCRNGEAVPLSTDHKPNVPSEYKRIKQAGGFVAEEHVPGHGRIFRVNGDLNLSRAIGDLEYKANSNFDQRDQIISAMPDVVTIRREPGDQFLVIACDGVWEVLDNAAIIDFVSKRLRKQTSLYDLVQELLDFIVAPDLRETRGIGGDNMSVILVVFNPEWEGPLDEHGLQRSYSDASSEAPSEMFPIRC